LKKLKKEIEAKRNPKNPYLFLPKGELRKRVEEHNQKIISLRWTHLKIISLRAVSHTP